MHSVWRYESFEEELDYWRAEIRRRLAGQPRPKRRLAREADLLAERTQRRIAMLKQTTPVCFTFAEEELQTLISRMTSLAAEAQPDDRPAAYPV
jgi:hypothetical protein